jgi:hypothetical protein
MRFNKFLRLNKQKIKFLILNLYLSNPVVCYVTKDKHISRTFMTKVFFRKPFSKITNQQNLTVVGSTDTSFEVMINSTGDIFARYTQTSSALNKLIPELVAGAVPTNIQ